MSQNPSPLNENQSCPHCHRSNITLHELPEVTFLFLKNHSLVETQFNKACKFCIEDFEKFRESPAIYLDQMKAELEHKKKLWQDRAEVLKNAYRLFQSNNFAEAEPKYREYITIIEKVFNVPISNISPQLFVNRGHPDELSTFTLVLWDLVIISDQNKLTDTEILASKFIEMAKGSIARSTLIHSIKKYRRKAHNKKLFKQILMDLRGGGGCFIATYAFAGNAYAPEVMILRQFRDEKLMPTFLGRCLVRFYYFVSPFLLRVLSAGENLPPEFENQRFTFNSFAKVSTRRKLYRQIIKQIIFIIE